MTERLSLSQCVKERELLVETIFYLRRSVHIKIMFTLYCSLKCTLALSKKNTCLNSKIVYCLKILTIPSEPLVSFNLLVGGGFYLSVDGCWLISSTECWVGCGTSYNKMTWNRAAQQAIIMELSWQESRNSAGNTHGPEQAGITQLSRQ